ncbi:uncharacterized protein LOC100880625 [Megachile rotundata]|uniref:uncharacterized protein LOC100880625 n=1 Tax=Megachile rotundata TaxID=143995 RepID=UPI003FD6BA61
MSYHASGDTRKIIQNSEDDEGYDNRSLYTLETSEKISLTPISTISDDTDRSFWGEDELSTSESTQQLNKKQKRRHTLSYRNRIAVHRSRSSLFQSSSSSLNSVSEQISSEDQIFKFNY